MSAHADKSTTPPADLNPEAPKPYFTAAGDLVIPNTSDPKYHWWKAGGQKVNKMLAELRAMEGKAES